MTAKRKAVCGVERGHYYEATPEGRGRDKEFVVKVWATDKKEGEPKEEWVMPGILGISLSISQAVIQTK